LKTASLSTWSTRSIYGPAVSRDASSFLPIATAVGNEQARIFLAVRFVCTDQAHAFGFMEAADRQITGRVADPSAPEVSWPYPGRERIYFASERDVHEGSLRA
jgi:hypothetical protein